MSTERGYRAGVRAEASIAGRLRDDIVTGVFSTGERLVEAELCGRYGCGRAVARAALVQLESEGLVERRPNRGAVVKRVSVTEAIEIIEARAALEAIIAARAAVHATDTERDELRAIIDEMRAAVGTANGQAYSELNSHLHRRLREVGRHAVAADLVNNLRNRGVAQQYRLGMVADRRSESLAQHAAIVDAVVTGDEAAAAAAMQAHLASVRETLRHWSDSPPFRA